MDIPFTCELEKAALDRLFARLEQRFDIWAPVRKPAGGRYAQTDSILYQQIHRYEEIAYRERSTFPMKDVLTPLTETMAYFAEDHIHESRGPEKDILLFGRACDINAVKILDQIYLENGGYVDPYYQRRRARTTFVLMECAEEFDGCFCCSVGANSTDMHALAFSFGETSAKIEVRDSAFADYFRDAPATDYTIKFPTENALKVTYPVIENAEMANALKNHPMWQEFDGRCIGCGACTVACSTCSCFETTDITYSQNAKVGERRRTCSSCMVEGFDAVAGGACFRKTIGERYRYKILHKVYGHDARFHSGPMCVGCGRCSARCPELISYPATLNKLSAAITEIKHAEAAHV